MTAWTYCNAEPIVSQQQRNLHAKYDVLTRKQKQTLQRLRDSKYANQGFFFTFTIFLYIQRIFY